MNRILTLAAKDLRLLLRDTRSVVILLAMPLIFILVLGLVLGEGFFEKPDDRLRISILVEDQGLAAARNTFPGKKWSDVVRDDMAETAGIRVETITSRQEAQRLIDSGQRAAVLVFGPEFSSRVHRCSFLDDRFTNEPGINPFYRDGVDLAAVGIDVIEDRKQVLAASVIKQVAQVSLLRVVMPWMIGRAFDKISDKQFIDELSRRVEVSSPFGTSKMKPLALLNEKQKGEVGDGVQASLQEIFRKYNLRAKTWASLTRSEQGTVQGGGVFAFQDLGQKKYQFLIPSYVVMFAFFMVLTAGWSFVAEKRQGTMLRLRAAPLTRAQILMGKVIPCFAISVGQGVFLFLAGRILFGLNLGPMPWMLLGVITTTSLAAVGLAMVVAAAAQTETQVAVYGTLLVLVLAGVSGCMMPRDQMPDLMRQLSLLTPHAWALDAYHELLLPNPNLTTVAINCGVLGLFGIFLLGISWKMLRLA
jgi:ABC-type multidrug transport system permease subunit